MTQAGQKIENGRGKFFAILQKELAGEFTLSTIPPITILEDLDYSGYSSSYCADLR